MVNREKYHNNSIKLLKLTKLTPSQLDTLKLIDLREHLKKESPEIITEMDSSDRYSSWVESGINTCFVDFLKYDGKKVGFVAIDIAFQPGFNQSVLNLGKVYILEKYRGKGIFANYVESLLKLSESNGYFLISLSEPNKYTINSLLKKELLHKLSNGLIIGNLGLMFTIRTKTELGDNKTLSAITPYYDSNLFAPVQLIDGQLMIGATCFIDEWDFNAKELRRQYTSSEKYMRQLGENIMEIGELFNKIAYEQISQLTSSYGKR